MKPFLRDQSDASSLVEPLTKIPNVEQTRCKPAWQIAERGTRSRPLGAQGSARYGFQPGLP
jgi:hypothetical protein